jgi:protein phosphatase PTC7
LGVDPSEFAWQLMDNCKEVVENDDIVDPKEILTKAYNTIVEKRQVKAGSSTACVLSLYDGDVEKGTATLAMANLGDSGFLVIREGTILFASQEQTHFFNAPYQLSIVPPSQSSDNHIKDTPDKSDTNKIEVKNGDIVVLGTDGLFDNLFADEIVSIVKEHSDVSVMGDTLVKKAFERAVSREDSPFAQGARKAGYFYNGGKLDDITVIVAKVHVK